MRNVIRFASFLLAVFCGVLASMTIEASDTAFPYGTSRVFTLDVHRSTASKSELISQLNGIADVHKVRLVKPAAGAVDPGKVRDVIYFGSAAPSSHRDVGWYSQRLKGSLISSANMADRSLNGEYAVSACYACIAELDHWANEAGVSLRWTAVRSDAATIRELTTSTASGLTLLSAALLMCAVALARFMELGKSRTIRVRAGIRPFSVHARDTFGLVADQAIGGCLGLAIALVFISIRHGLQYVRPFAALSGFLFAATSLTVASVFAVVSWIVRPKLSQIAARRDSTVLHMHLGRVIRFGAVAVAVAVVPHAAGIASRAAHGYEEAERWTRAKDSVRLTLSTVTMENESRAEFLARLARFAKDRDVRSNSALSFAVDQMIDIPSSVRAPYDHVVVVDVLFLRLMGIDRRDALRADPSVPPPLGEAVEMQKRSWSPSGETLKMRGFAQKPGVPLPVIGYPLDAANSVNPKKALVYVIDDPLPQIAVDGALDALVSNGQIVFTDADVLRKKIDEYGLNSYVSSIDSVPDQLLLTAQAYAQQASIGVIGAALALTSVAVALLLSAMTWGRAERRRIFSERTAGRTDTRIAKRPFLWEMALAGAACLFSCVAGVTVLREPRGLVLGAGAGIFALCVVGAWAAYRQSIDRAFRRTIRRDG